MEVHEARTDGCQVWKPLLQEGWVDEEKGAPAFEIPLGPGSDVFDAHIGKSLVHPAVHLLVVGAQLATQLKLHLELFEVAPSGVYGQTFSEGLAEDGAVELHVSKLQRDWRALHVDDFGEGQGHV